MPGAGTPCGWAFNNTDFNITTTLMVERLTSSMVKRITGDTTKQKQKM